MVMLAEPPVEHPLPAPLPTLDFGDLDNEAVEQLSDADILSLLDDKVATNVQPQMTEIIHRGDSFYPAPAVLQAMKESGWIFMYNVATRERSLVGRNSIPGKLKERDEHGKPVWTLSKPEGPPLAGHPEVPPPPRRPRPGAVRLLGPAGV